MSKLNIALVIVLVILLAFAKTDSATTVAPEMITPTTVPTPTPDPIGSPVRFFIPKIGVDAPVEAVGTDIQGTMSLPQSLSTVGWYREGFKPGQKGNAVIAGHLDSATGETAIFYHLGNLEPGDTMNVLDEKGAFYTFTVTEKNVYPYNEVPIEYVFGESPNKVLNLITCTGVWNWQTQNYSHRMIVRAVLTEE